MAMVRQPNSHSCIVYHLLVYRSWHAWLDGACHELQTETQLYTHPTGPQCQTSVWGDARWVVCQHLSLKTFSLTDVSDGGSDTTQAPTLYWLFLHDSSFGWRCRGPKLAAAIDPAWPCHSCGLIIRLITPPLCFVFFSSPQLIGSALFSAGLPQHIPSEVKSNFIKRGVSRDRPSNLVRRAFCCFWQLLVRKAGNALNSGRFRLGVVKWWGSTGVPVGPGAC